MGVFNQVIARMPTLHHQTFHISPVLRCFRKCAKMRTFESERVNSGSLEAKVLDQGNGYLMHNHLEYS